MNSYNKFVIYIEHTKKEVILIVRIAIAMISHFGIKKLEQIQCLYYINFSILNSFLSEIYITYIY